MEKAESQNDYVRSFGKSWADPALTLRASLSFLCSASKSSSSDSINLWLSRQVYDSWHSQSNTQVKLSLAFVVLDPHSINKGEKKPYWNWMIQTVFELASGIVL